MLLVKVVLAVVVSAALYVGVFQTENALSYRISQKYQQFERIGIDRQPLWEEGIREISTAPFGEGWTYRTGHSDWLLFTLSYGWPTGLLYAVASAWLFGSMWSALRRSGDNADGTRGTLLLAGLAALSVYFVNSVLDMLSANIGYYETTWALILVPATVAAVCHPNIWPTECLLGSTPPVPSRQPREPKGRGGPESGSASVGGSYSHR